MNSDSGDKTRKPMSEVGSHPDDGFTSVSAQFTEVNSPKSGESSRRYVSVEKVKLHQILKKLMEESKVSAKRLSAELKIPAPTLSTYLSGKKASYKPEHLIALAEYFGVSVDFLLQGKSSTLEELNSLTTEQLFSGWLKVKIERAIVDDKKGKGDK